MPAPSDHSNIVGGSIAEARIACPASWSMENKLPRAARQETTTYADEGSALHAAIAHVLDNDLSAQDVLGMTFAPFDKFPITQALIDDALKPSLDYFDALDETYGPLEFQLEQRLPFPGIDGAFGTCDVLARGRDVSFVIDWKFGAGEKVQAKYEAEDGTVWPNDQGMFYLTSAFNARPALFPPGNRIEIHIAQPRYREGANFDSVEVDALDIGMFQEELVEAIELAQSPTPPMRKGKHCRFMACKAICPLHTGPILELPELASLTGKAALTASVNGGGEGVTGRVAPAINWDATYGLMMDLAERIEPVLREWRSQAQAHLEAGGIVDGWKLVERRGTRKWTEEADKVERKLRRLGLYKDEYMPRTLISPPQAEKLLKAKSKALPEGYYSTLSSGLTIAPSRDPREDAQSVGDLARALATSLAALGVETIEANAQSAEGLSDE